MKVPQVIALLLCDRMGLDPSSGQVSLLGIFQARYFPTFPSPPQNFTAYVALYDGEGDGTMELLLTRLETEEDITLYKKWLTFPGRGQIVNVEIKVRNCEFPAPGRYALTLSFDNKLLTQRYLEIYRKENSQ
jgi:hypothetical protein